jgi:hypothetical protein
MPLEGHWRTTNTPLRRLGPRERNVVIAVMAVTVVAILGLLLVPPSESQPAPAPGCIRVVVAGRVGGEVLHPCGAEAKLTCARSASFDTPRSRTILASCKEAGIEY